MTALLLAVLALYNQKLRTEFASPPDSARPWVYWYFMEGNMTRDGMTADLEDMKRSGLGGGIFLEVNIGIPVGPVKYMSPQWLSLVGHAVHEAGRLGLGIDLGTGPGWCGTGGPWVTPEHAMQHLVASQTNVKGPSHFEGTLARPRPREPFFGRSTLTPELLKLWEDFYQDEAVVAVPTALLGAKIEDLDGKSLVYRGAYSSQPNVPAFLKPNRLEGPAGSAVDSKSVIDLTSKLSASGELTWDVPAGNWTVYRFGRTLTGQTSRPAPNLGLGFETDKFDREGITAHLDHFIDAIVQETGPNQTPGRGLTALHFDSWEMGSQNWSAKFRDEFKARRGYDPLRYLPVLAGAVVDSVNISERFLWDVRRTAHELVIANHVGTIKRRADQYGLGLSLEPYDLNPTADLDLGAAATEPMGEFWSKGFGYNTEYSCIEAVSVGHTNGKKVIGAESFTADDGDRWLQHPGSMKAQADWALGCGINKIYFHRYEHQPETNVYPGMSRGPYGVHWERTETWWDMVPAFHRYLARCSHLLRQGLPVADILYLIPQGAPNVFTAPNDATIGNLPDRRRFNFDACSPDRLIAAAKVKDGRIVFPDGMSYQLLVLPRVDAMTPSLALKLEEMISAGASIVCGRPKQSPSLQAFPEADTRLNHVCDRLFGDSAPGTARKVGKGTVFVDHVAETRPVDLYGSQWIWTDEGDPTVAAPIGDRNFEIHFSMAPGKYLKRAQAAFTADNRFRLVVNGTQCLEGTDFHKVGLADVGSLLRAGDNTIRVLAANDGDAPNPAGVLGKIAIDYSDGSSTEVRTGPGWKVSGRSKLKVLGPWTMGPWGLNSQSLPSPSMYPDYSTTEQILQNDLHVSPDLDSDDSLRYSHRKLSDSDLYFVANRTGSDYTGEALFRVLVGTPEWWDPITGNCRPLPKWNRSHGVTMIPMHLSKDQSGFVVFSRHASQAQAAATNFPELHPVAAISGSWVVSFEKRFGGPSSARFDHLSDWKENSDPAIRFYSGKAVYRKKFDAPVSAQRALVLDLGSVCNAASVRLNGVNIGTAWCAPFRVEIPNGLLKAKGNTLEVTVANLWANRLIGDSALPENQRVTHTTWQPYGAKDPLLPSGLLGPVRVLQLSN